MSICVNDQDCTKPLRQHFFSNRVIENWNRLPEQAMTASPINVFKGWLDERWANYLYDH